MGGESDINDCPARHLCVALEINLECGSDICPRREKHAFPLGRPLPREVTGG